MSYETLEKQIRSLPGWAQQEVAHYVGYLTAQYCGSDETVSERADAFMRENPTAFGKFMPVREAGIEAIRELTKHDAW